MQHQIEAFYIVTGNLTITMPGPVLRILPDIQAKVWYIAHI